MGPIARIRTIGEAEATGTVKEFYEKLRRERGTVATLYQALSLKPEAMWAREAMTRAVSRGSTRLGRRMEEMLATVVSAANTCHY